MGVWSLCWVSSPCIITMHALQWNNAHRCCLTVTVTGIVSVTGPALGGLAGAATTLKLYSHNFACDRTTKIHYSLGVILPCMKLWPYIFKAATIFERHLSTSSILSMTVLVTGVWVASVPWRTSKVQGWLLREQSKGSVNVRSRSQSQNQRFSKWSKEVHKSQEQVPKSAQTEYCQARPSL